MNYPLCTNNKLAERVKFSLRQRMYYALVEKYGTIAQRQRMFDKYKSVRDPDFRKEFIKLIRVPAFVSNSSHPKSTASRTGNRVALINAIRDVGMEPYEISPDQSALHAGRRDFWCEKDLHHKQRSDVVDPNHVLLFIDVDYYPENFDDYLRLGQPIVIYTFNPKASFGVTDEYSWRSTIENEVIYEVQGGEKYRHKLWNWDMSSVSAPLKSGGWITYLVERRTDPTDPNHCIVVLSPSAISPPSLLKDIPRNRMKRRNLNQVIICGSTVYIPGPALTVEVPLNAWNAILAMRSAGTLERARVNNVLRNAGMTDTVLVIDSLIEVIKADPTCEYRSDTTISRGAFCLPDSDTVKPCLKETIQPLVEHPAAVPTLDEAMEDVSIQKRVVETDNSRHVASDLQKFVDEFVVLSIPATKLSPIDVMDYLDQMNRPSQKARATIGVGNFQLNTYTGKVDTNTKGESKDSYTAARLYDSPEPGANAELMTYVKPLTQHLQENFKYFMPGRKPHEIAEALQELKAKFPLLDMDDIESFDGSMSAQLCNAFETFFSKSFKYSFRKNAVKLYKQMMGSKRRFRSGKKVPKTSALLSGLSLTSLFGTFINALIHYVSKRVDGLTKSEAIDSLGVYFGDDSVTPHSKSAVQVFKAFNMTLKQYTTDEEIEFLSRVFPDITNSLASHCKLDRALSKIHYGKTDDIQHLANKCLGYRASDSLTPVLGDFCDKVLELVCPDEAKLDRETAYKLTMSWPQDSTVITSEHLYDNLDEESCCIFVEALEKVTDIEGLNSLPDIANKQKKVKIAHVNAFGDSINPTATPAADTKIDPISQDLQKDLDNLLLETTSINNLFAKHGNVNPKTVPSDPEPGDEPGDGGARLPGIQRDLGSRKGPEQTDGGRNRRQSPASTKSSANGDGPLPKSTKPAKARKRQGKKKKGKK
jgi:hypothetical protein